METQPKLSMYESCLQKVHEFFKQDKSKETYELGAAILGQEKEENITLTDLLTPKKECIIRAKPECTKSYHVREIMIIYKDQVELISTRNSCVITGTFYRRINCYLEGKAHNHITEGKTTPSSDDFESLISFLPKTNPENKFIVEIIYTPSHFDIFCYPKEVIKRFMRVNEEDYYPFFVQEFAKWFEDHYSQAHVKEFEIIKGK